MTRRDGLYISLGLVSFNIQNRRHFIFKEKKRKKKKEEIHKALGFDTDDLGMILRLGKSISWPYNIVSEVRSLERMVLPLRSLNLCRWIMAQESNPPH